MGKVPLILGRPKDRSLQAYKDFINAFAATLGANAESDISDEEWERRWREFWGDEAEGEMAAKRAD